MPFIVAGLHVALGRAIIATVSVEFIAGLTGLGTYILLNARSYHQNEAFVAVAVLALLGVTARICVILVLRRIAPWHNS
jgi:ABC-type nitrate/sulfonate/bicarbonate transport system permease component